MLSNGFGKKIDIDSFLRLMKEKARELNFTVHARARCENRTLPESIVENDLLSGRPLIAFEQESESKNERKFNVYYKQSAGYSHRYVIALNGEVRVITVMRISRDMQKLMAGDKK